MIFKVSNIPLNVISKCYPITIHLASFLSVVLVLIVHSRGGEQHGHVITHQSWTQDRRLRVTL